MIIAGHNNLSESPLPGLYAQFGGDSQKFVDIAWIRVVMDLVTHNIVTEIELLEITLDEDGPRLRIYLRAKHGEDDVILDGNCDLNSSEMVP